MTKEHFISILKKKKYKYKEEDDKIIITSGEITGMVNFGFNEIKSIPSGVIFENHGDVSIETVKILDDIEFKNDGSVYIPGAIKIFPGVKFNNSSAVYMDILGVNTAYKISSNFLWVSCPLNTNTKVPTRGSIDSKVLLNKMIERGIFTTSPYA